MLLRFIIAIVVAVVVSVFYQGHIKGQLLAFDVITSLSFVFSGLITLLIIHFIGDAQPSLARATSASDATREEGTVKWFNVSKGFGFITRGNGEDIFVHYRSIRGHGRRRLFDGQQVSFTVIPSDKGSQADDVVILKQ